FDKVFMQLEKLGLLLLSKSGLPSVVDLISKRGELKGSWWSHPEAHTIFAVSELLEDHPDVLIMKLIDGKVTFVHRELWSRIYPIGVAREDWQVKALSPAAKLLLKRVDAEGKVRTGGLGKTFDPKPGVAARELEHYLLIHSKQTHGATGAHYKILQTWDEWAKSVGFKARAKSPGAARRVLEERLEWIIKEYGGHGRFPWPPNV
ncbi:MAG TPA: hypothetical protein VF074_19040, partial [Pyrinomonadaceae bacterium]